MDKRLLWIGGWASPLKCWSEILENSYSDFEHEYWDANQIIETEKPFLQKLKSMDSESCIVAWSMGAHWLLRSLESERFNCSAAMVLVSPFPAFCRPRGHWPRVTVEKMIQALDKNRDEVLDNFWNLMVRDIPKLEWENMYRRNSWDQNSLRSAWLRQSESYTSERLQNGLKYLLSSESNYKAKPDLKACLLHSPLDGIVSENPNWLASWPQKIRYQAGHIPFLTEPEQLIKAFQELNILQSEENLIR